MKLGADFSALIERFSPNRDSPIGIAVSGGSDSLALLYLAQEWARENDRSIIAVTVDHQLRAESALEARQVADICASLGIAHETMVWAHPKSGQSAARRARYMLLAQAVRSAGGSVILTGHSFDDVVETVLIRRRRGIRGPMQTGPTLAAPVPTWPEGRDLTLVRPLISTLRSELQSYLRTKSQAWITDPSNAQTDYERVRVRQFLGRHRQLGVCAARAVQRLQTERYQSDDALGSELDRVRVYPDGLIQIADPAASLRLLTLVARCASGSVRDARAGAMADLVSRLETPGQRQTLGGAWFQRTADGYLVGRDPGRMEFCSSSNNVFDGRYVASAEARLPAGEARAYLVRHAMPDSDRWREIISARISHLAQCAKTAYPNLINA